MPGPAVMRRQPVPVRPHQPNSDGPGTHILLWLAASLLHPSLGPLSCVVLSADSDESPSARYGKRKRELGQAQPMDASPDVAESAAAAERELPAATNGTAELNGGH